MDQIHPKVAGGAVGSMIAVVAVWGINKGVVLPSDVNVSIAGLISAFAAWLTPSVKKLEDLVPAADRPIVEQAVTAALSDAVDATGQTVV